VLTKAPFEHDAIGMRATVIAHLGHEPTRARSPQPVGLRTVWWQQTGSCVYIPVLAGGAARGLNHHLLVDPTLRVSMIRYSMRQSAGHQQGCALNADAAAGAPGEAGAVSRVRRLT